MYILIDSSRKAMKILFPEDVSIELKHVGLKHSEVSDCNLLHLTALVN
jgi:hypothetical protein